MVFFNFYLLLLKNLRIFAFFCSFSFKSYFLSSIFFTIKSAITISKSIRTSMFRFI
nr:MAG TPA: hypothetical protein [Caudoviricetes sp.]